MAKAKFDVSFLSEKGKEVSKVVSNDFSGIEKFLSGLPEDALLCAEHTGVYGELLVHLCHLSGVCICLVPGYEIKHRMGLVRGKDDKIDARRIREYAERFEDKLRPVSPKGEDMDALHDLYTTRCMLVQQRKRLRTHVVSKDGKVFRAIAAARAENAVIEALDEQIRSLEQEIMEVIRNSPEMKENFLIATSVPGIGTVTACELIIKTENFKRIDSAKRIAAFAGIAPYPNSTGKSDRGTHVSKLGDKEIKSLLYMCARNAKKSSKEFLLYYYKKHEIEKKNHFVVLNNIANKQVKILYALIRKKQLFDKNYIHQDPRCRDGKEQIEKNQHL